MTTSTNDQTLTLSGTAGAAGNTEIFFQVTAVDRHDGGRHRRHLEPGRHQALLADGAYQRSRRGRRTRQVSRAASAAFPVTTDADCAGASDVRQRDRMGSVTDGCGAEQTCSRRGQPARTDPTLSIDRDGGGGSTARSTDTDGTTAWGPAWRPAGRGRSSTSPSEGAHTSTIEESDGRGAGNRGAASTAFHVTIDTVAPSAPVIDKA